MIEVFCVCVFASAKPFYFLKHDKPTNMNEVIMHQHSPFSFKYEWHFYPAPNCPEINKWPSLPSPNDICVYLFHHHRLTWCLPILVLVYCILHVFYPSMWPTTSPPLTPRFTPPFSSQTMQSSRITVAYKLDFEYFQFFIYSLFLLFPLLVWNVSIFSSPNSKTHLGFWFVGLSRCDYPANKRQHTWLPVATPCLQRPTAVTRQVSPRVHCLTWSLLLNIIRESYALLEMPFNYWSSQLISTDYCKHHGKNRNIDILQTKIASLILCIKEQNGAGEQL
jgi:hypothetical protein